jgi:hypothetical protein
MKRIAMILAAAVVGVAMFAPSAQAAFGLEDFSLVFEGGAGASALQAGSHPFAVTSTVNFHTIPNNLPFLEEPEGAPRNIDVKLPAGLVGNPSAVPQCSNAEFVDINQEFKIPNCSDGSVVGVVTLRVLGNSEAIEYISSPVYDLVPPPGAVQKLGFTPDGVPVAAEFVVDESQPYDVIVKFTNTSQVLQIYRVKLTLWGNPANPAHDPERGNCVSPQFTKTEEVPGFENEPGKTCPSGVAEKPFITLPRSCGPLSASYVAEAWQPFPVDKNSISVPTTTGCERLGFSPTIEAAPTSKAAESPSGFDFALNLQNEGLTSPAGISNADVEKAVVTLPEGFSINPSQAEGLNVCSEADLSRETAFSEPGAGCPNESKIGTVEVETPLLEEPVKGALYVATPYENPEHSLIALYMVLQNEKLGISIKLPLRVETNSTTGQITAVGEDLPQLPFEHFKLHFREGARSPLATPAACGTYAAQATLYPSSGGAPVNTNSAFQIISGPESGPCPSGGTPPFHPGLIAGSINNAAGAYSPFDVRLFRTDSEQEITHFSIKLPPGVLGKLAGIPFCSDQAIAAAKAREGQPRGGTEELEHPSCPAASEVGHTLVGAGVGPSLTYVPGKVYLAGPYKGSNLSIVAITAAKAGPFDLGTVVIREGLKVDPTTAQVSVDAAGSDPIPHIIDGIPVHLRDIRVYVDRPEFVLNPTSCEPTSTASTVLGSGTNFASEADDQPVTVTSPFQAADCASLGFKPQLNLKLLGKTKRAGLPKLVATVTYPKGGGYANIAKTIVNLPDSEFLEQGHIGTVCTRVQFNEGGGNGEKCPKKSVYGHAKAITPLLEEPVEGPVYLRSNGGERQLPDLVAALHSKDIDINLVGFIDSVHKKGTERSAIRTRFLSVPDAPVSKFTLEMSGGKKGLLINSTNLCKGTHKAKAQFTGQNGKLFETNPEVQAQCGKKSAKGKGAKGSGGKKKGGGGKKGGK